MLRKISVNDFEQLKPIISAQAERYSSLKPDWARIKSLLTDCASSAQNFGLVSVNCRSEIKGAFCALSYNNLWAGKQSSSVMLWACDGTGDGVYMLRQYLAWVDSRPLIRRAGFQFDLDIDSRVLSVIERLGFKREGGCYLKYKG